MATTLDTLLVRIEADMTGLRRDLSRVEGQVKTFGSNANNSLQKIEGATSGASTAFKALGAAIATALGALTIGRVVSVIREFEDLEARLKSITPNAETAAAAFTLITKYSETTTFQLQEVTQAFITLASAGIAPTKQVLIDVGNLAAARGKRIQDVAQAIMNATTGEFEMLKGLGIVVRTEGDNAIATFNGVSTTISRSNILEYLQKISQTNFADATAKAADTLTGKLSNLEDATNRFYNQIGEGGLKQALVDVVLLLTQTTDEGQSLATTIGQALGAAVRGLGAAIMLVKDNFVLLTKIALAFLAVLTAQKIVGLATAMVTFAVSTGKAAAAFAAINALLAKNKLMVLALALLAAGEALGLLDNVIDGLNKKIFGTTNETEELKQTMDEASAVIAAALGDKPRELTQKFRDTIAGLREDMIAAKLEASGMSKELVAGLKSAGMLTQFNERGQFTGNSNELTDLENAVDKLQTANIEKQLFNFRKELDGLVKENNLSELDKQFSQFVGKENFETLQKFPKIFNSLRDSFVGIKQEDAMREISKQLQSINQEAATTDQFEIFFNKLTEGARSVLSSNQLAILREEARSVFTSMEVGQKQKASIEAGISAVRSYDTEEQKIRKTMIDVTAARDAQRISTEEYTLAMGKLNDQLKMTNPIMKTMSSFIDQMESSMTGALVNIFTGVESISDSFKSVMRNLTNTVLQEVTRMLIVVPLMNAIRASLGMTTVPTPDASLFGDFMPSSSLPAATGGAMFANQPRLVGENGPELFIPHSAGTLMNSNNTRSAMGGGGAVTVNQTIAVTTGVQATVRAEINSMMPQIAEVTKAAVAQAAQRGGSYRKAFA